MRKNNSKKNQCNMSNSSIIIITALIVLLLISVYLLYKTDAFGDLGLEKTDSSNQTFITNENVKEA